MRIERRINRIRIGVLTTAVALDLVTASFMHMLVPSYLAFIGGVVLVGGAALWGIDRLARGDCYRGWLKYATITLDYLVLTAFVIEVLELHEIRPFDLGKFNGVSVSITMLLVAVSALRLSRAAILYSTAIGSLVVLVTAALYGTAFVVQLWGVPLVLMIGGVALWISGNERSLMQTLWRRERLKRFLPHEVVELVESGDVDIELGGTNVNVTILIADIRGFTKLFERRRPEEIVAQLNQYFTAMAEVIFAHGGMIDKYIGDAVMAVFGVPVACGDDAIRAVKAAGAMLHKLGELNQRWQQDGLEPLEIGISLHTGEVVAGNIGSPERMEYTVIGDTVNLASRLEGLNKIYQTRVILSEHTRRELGRHHPARYLDETRVRGREQPIRIYTLDT